jgi:hypothetical protein
MVSRARWMLASVVIWSAGCAAITGLDKDYVDGTASPSATGGSSSGNGGAGVSGGGQAGSGQAGAGQTGAGQAGVGAGGLGGAGGGGGGGGSAGATAGGGGAGSGGKGGQAGAAGKAGAGGIGGMSGTSGNGGAGGAATCMLPGDCPAPAKTCFVADCQKGMCGSVPAPLGATCGSGASVCDGAGQCGTCLPGAKACNGNVPTLCDASGQAKPQTACAKSAPICAAGDCVQCAAPSDCPASANPCAPATCVAGKCGVGSQPAGTSCGKNQACDAMGACGCTAGHAAYSGPLGSGCLDFGGAFAARGTAVGPGACVPSILNPPTCLEPNPFTGTCACPAGFTEDLQAVVVPNSGFPQCGVIGFCRAPTFDAASEYGGVFLTSNSGGCLTPNSLTMSCSCPMPTKDVAVDVMRNLTAGNAAKLHVCVGDTTVAGATFHGAYETQGAMCATPNPVVTTGSPCSCPGDAPIALPVALPSGVCNGTPGCTVEICASSPLVSDDHAATAGRDRSAVRRWITETRRRLAADEHRRRSLHDRVRWTVALCRVSHGCRGLAADLHVRRPRRQHRTADVGRGPGDERTGMRIANARRCSRARARGRGRRREEGEDQEASGSCESRHGHPG